MKKYKCLICGFEYDPSKGFPDLGILPGTSFEDLPEEFECPLCGAGKDEFEPQEVEESSLSKYAATLVDVIWRTPSIKSFRFSLPAPIRFDPGQHLILALDGTSQSSRCLSISNSPTEDGYLEVTKRITQSTFSQLLNRAEPGFQAEIEAPRGDFTLPAGSNKICFLSGGIGITPFRSMSRYALDAGLDLDICLLCSNRAREEIAFRADFDEMEQRCDALKVIHTLTREEADWNGRTGRICSDMIREVLPDYAERDFYVCGPPSMVVSQSAMLQNELKLPSSRIKSEKFEGYL